ncbi:MAG: glycerol-3-phosphate 1-O-acyltransferase PlsY [Clostridia bacterium]
MNFFTVIVVLITYFVCSINPAIEICKFKTGQDIRKLGSGNAGTANAMRVLGKPIGILVVLLDVSKVFLSFLACIMLGKVFNQDIGVAMRSVFMVSAVVGHCFPIYYKFRGGKGIIVGITIAVIINKQIALICIIVGIVVIIVTRVVSISTLIGLLTYIILAFFQMSNYIIPISIVALIIIFKHRGNIQRIFNRQEERLW